MTDRVFKALGAGDELEALRIVENMNKFMASVKAVTGHDTFSTSINAMKVAFSFLKEVTATAVSAEQAADGVAAPSPDALLGQILAWKDAHGKLPASEAKVAELEEAVRADRVEALIAQGREDVRPGCGEHAGKMTPNLASYFRNKKATAEEVEEFLKATTRVLPGAVNQPAVHSGSPITTNAEGRVVTSEGKTYEQLLPVARQELKAADKHLWEAMKNDWEKFGCPPGIIEASN